MAETVKALLMVYALMLLINAIVSALCLHYFKDQLYKYALLLWISTVFVSALQGYFQHSVPEMVLSFSSYFVCTLIQIKILTLVTHEPLPWRTSLAVMVTGLGISFWLFTQNLDFLWLALPVAIGNAFPLLWAGISTLVSEQRREVHGGVRIYSALLIFNGLHMLDYPFLRNHPEYGPFGFSVMLLILFTFSIFMPSFIFKDVFDRYRATVEDLNTKVREYQNQTTELMSLAQVGELSYSFVHDMASPTTLLMFYASELATMQNKQGSTSRDQILPYSQGIEKATQRLISLQKMFKSLIKTDPSAKKVMPVDLTEVIQNCVDLFGPYFRRNQITASARITTTDPLIQTQAGVIDRILLNLIQNAVNALAGQEREKLIIVTLLEVTPSEILIRVEDTGPGISADRLAHLWERFGPSDTARNSTDKNANKRSGGSGFGLFKIKQLTEEIGGTITVQTTANVGTVFEIRLPRLLKDQSPPVAGS